jgi:hypothetical protein
MVLKKAQMKIFTGICSVIVLAWLFVTTSVPRAPVAQPCTQEWFSYLEGHGPDLGNSEWVNAFEEKAKLLVTNGLPKQQRCQLIQGQLERRTYVINEQLGWTFLL